jgi:hypothetical protein
VPGKRSPLAVWSNARPAPYGCRKVQAKVRADIQAMQCESRRFLLRRVNGRAPSVKSARYGGDFDT